MAKQLLRNESNKMIAGVCSGLADYFGVDPTLVRIGFVIATVAFGIGVLPYIILWIVIPKQ
jgi:phage shock protein C